MRAASVQQQQQTHLAIVQVLIKYPNAGMFIILNFGEVKHYCKRISGVVPVLHKKVHVLA